MPQPTRIGPTKHISLQYRLRSEREGGKQLHSQTRRSIEEGNGPWTDPQEAPLHFLTGVPRGRHESAEWNNLSNWACGSTAQLSTYGSAIRKQRNVPNATERWLIYTYQRASAGRFHESSATSRTVCQQQSVISNPFRLRSVACRGV